MSSDVVNAPSASGAADAAREVGAQATDQVKAVAGEARDQFGQLLGKTQHELRGRAQEQSDRAVSALRTLAGQLNALGEGRSDDAGPLADYLSEAQGKVEQFAERLSARGPHGVLEDLAGFARRKPAVFLLLAGGAGFAVGRITRAGVAARKDSADFGARHRGLPRPCRQRRHRRRRRRHCPRPSRQPRDRRDTRRSLGRRRRRHLDEAAAPRRLGH